jgi:hypothetical protein
MLDIEGGAAHGHEVALLHALLRHLGKMLLGPAVDVDDHPELVEPIDQAVPRDERIEAREHMLRGGGTLGARGGDDLDAHAAGVTEIALLETGEVLQLGLGSFGGEDENTRVALLDTPVDEPRATELRGHGYSAASRVQPSFEGSPRNGIAPKRPWR